MTAKEMFEALGYVREDNNGVIVYRHYVANQSICMREIDFWFDFKEYSAVDKLGGLFIDMSLHQTIHKQLEELGWLDE